jgi:ABC-type enterochelin transport system substrate-binding protein
VSPDSNTKADLAIAEMAEVEGFETVVDFLAQYQGEDEEADFGNLFQNDFWEVDALGMNQITYPSFDKRNQLECYPVVR